MQIVGQGMTVPEFEKYLTGIHHTAWTPRFVVVHNTSAPDMRLYESWQHRPNWTGEQWMRNLRDYYSGMGWPGGPHLFVAPDKIWLFTPLWMPGTHSPSWNRFTWGVETVGEFDREPFDGPIRANLVGALAALHRHAEMDPADYKLGVRGLHFHKEDVATTHRDCPGRHVVKAELVQEVVEAMGGHVHDYHLPSVTAQSADTTALPTEASTIRWVQQRLRDLGYGALAVDNVVGPATRAAVRLFQREHPPLIVDGIAGPMTRIALNGARNRA